MKVASSAAVLLAAGAGTRFAGPGHKLHADAGGLPVVVRSVAAAVEAGFDDVFVVWGAVPLDRALAASGLSEPVRTLFNPLWQDGIATSLALGIETAEVFGYGSVVVGLGDMPAVSPEDWRAVATCAESSVVVTRWSDGHLSPPVRIERDVWGLVPGSGDVGVRHLWTAGDPVRVTRLDRPGTGRDVDTVADLCATTDLN